MFPSDLLDIDGPFKACLLPSRMYGLVQCDDRHAAALLWGALLAPHGRAAWLIADDASCRFLSGAGPLAQQARDAVAKGSVTVLQAAGMAMPGATPDVAAQVLAELAHFRIPDGALVVFDCAAPYLAEHDLLSLAALRRWRDWAENGGHSVLLVFKHQDTQALDFTAELIRQATLFGGIARLRSSSGLSSLEIFHWFTLESAIAGRTLTLARNGAGRVVGHEALAQQPAVAPAADVALVYCMPDVLQGNQEAPPHWVMLDGLDALQKQTGQAKSATVVLCFDRKVVFDTLARAIFLLRQNCGKRLKIVVREVDRQRYSQEGLMMRVGANLIVPPEVKYAHFLSMVAMVQGQVFSRPQPPSFESAVADMVIGQSRGYLPPEEFVRDVNLALENGRMIGIESIVVRLALNEGVSALDALHQCTAARAGDLYSADLSCVYVFLFACQESDATGAIARLLRMPVSDLFHGEERYFSSQTMRTAIDELAARAAGGALPDLTLALADPGTRETHRPKSKATLHMNHLLHVAPLAARPFALPLRAAQAAEAKPFRRT